MAVIPNTNVNLATNVRDVLSGAGGSVSNDTTSFFKTAAKINKWAKYKPESYEKDFDLTDNDRYLNNHGIDVTGMLRISVPDIFNNAKNGNIWKYNLPTGTKTSPYRLGDFRKYNTDAKPPFDYRYINKEGSSIANTYETSWRVVKSNGSELKMSDFEMFDSVSSTHYFFIARKNDTYVVSTLVSKSGDPSEIICDITFPSAGVWEWIFCLGRNTSEDVLSRLDVVPLPDGYGTFEFTKTYVYINITYTGGAVTKLDYDNSQYLLTIGNINPSYQMVASSTPITDTELEFGFEVYLLDSSKRQIAVNSIYSTDGNDLYTFNSSNGTQTKSLINFPGQIDMKDYFNESDLYSAKYARFYPKANRISGIGIPSNPNTYYEIAL